MLAAHFQCIYDASLLAGRPSHGQPGAMRGKAMCLANARSVDVLCCRYSTHAWGQARSPCIGLHAESQEPGQLAPHHMHTHARTFSSRRPTDGRRGGNGMGWDEMRWMDKVRLLRTALLASIHLHAGMQREHTSTVKPRADRSGQPTYIHTDSLAAGCLSWSSSAIGSGTRSRSCGFMKQDTHTRAHAYAHAKSIGGREGPWGHM